MTKEKLAQLKENKQKIHTDPDFIDAKRYDNSLTVFSKRYTGNTTKDVAPNKIITKVLGLASEEELENLFQTIIKKLRKLI